MMKYSQLLFCFLLCYYSANADEELWRTYPNRTVVDAAESGNSLYMVGTTLFEYNWDEAELFNYVLNDLNPQTDALMSIDISEDEMYMGTTKGLFVVYNDSLKVMDGQDLGLSDQRILSIDHVFDALWLGTISDGILKLHSGGSTRFTTANSDLPCDSIRCYYQDNSGAMWVGTLGGGICKILANNNVIIPEDFPARRVSRIKVDKTGKLLFATGDGGLIVRDADQWISYTTENSGICSNALNDVVVDEDNNYWIGSQQHGIMKFDGQNWEAVTSANSDLVNDMIYRLHYDSRGNLWCFTVMGISVYNPDGLILSLEELGIVHSTNVFPNPASVSEIININDNRLAPGLVRLKLIDPTGAILHSSEITSSGSGFRYMLPSGLSRGCYLLVATDAMGRPSSYPVVVK